MKTLPKVIHTGEEVIAGGIYESSKNGTIVFVIENNLETFTGIVLKLGKLTEKEDKKTFKEGKKYNCFNSDMGWIPLLFT